MNVILRRFSLLFMTTLTLVLYLPVVQVRGMADMGILATLLEDLPRNAVIVFVFGIAGVLLTRMYPVHLNESILTGAMFFLFVNTFRKFDIFGGQQLSMSAFFAIASIVISISIGLVFKKE
jgi:hypothetical protein